VSTSPQAQGFFHPAISSAPPTISFRRRYVKCFPYFAHPPAGLQPVRPNSAPLQASHMRPGSVQASTRSDALPAQATARPGVTCPGFAQPLSRLYVFMSERPSSAAEEVGRRPSGPPPAPGFITPGTRPKTSFSASPAPAQAWGTSTVGSWGTQRFPVTN
jgi:hypothetical protein